MNAGEMKDEVFSHFTFSLLKDSGWYGYDRYAIEHFNVGKNVGCDWFKNCHSEKNDQYFCKRINQDGCYFDFSAIGYCTN